MTSITFVVPLDGSPYAERALPIATAFAERVGGNLMLVSVSDRTGPLQPKDYLEEVVATPRPVPVETVSVTRLAAAEAIAKIARESDDRVVCMTSHGRGGLRWGLLGSVAEEVVRRSERPTLLIGHHCRDDFFKDARYLLACVDRESAPEFAPIVTEWAARLELDMHAAVVVHPHDSGSIGNPEAVLEPIVEDFGGSDHIAATLLQSRYAPGALADYAADLRAAVIAVDGRCRTGMARFALGSTTMGLVHQAHCPVLVAPRSMYKGEQ